MTIPTTLYPEKVEAAATAHPNVESRATCTIEGSLIRRLILVVYFLALTLPTIAMFLIPDPRAFLIYSGYMFVAIVLLIPTSLIFLASIDSRLVIYRTKSNRIRVKFTSIETVKVYTISKV